MLVTRGLRVCLRAIVAMICRKKTKKKSRETRYGTEREGGSERWLCRKNVEPRNSGKTRGDTCRLEAKYIEIPKSTRMFSVSSRSLSRDDPRRHSSPSSSAAKCPPRFSSCATFVNVTAAAHPRRPSAFPAKKLDSLAHIMAHVWPLSSKHSHRECFLATRRRREKNDRSERESSSVNGTFWFPPMDEIPLPDRLCPRMSSHRSREIGSLVFPIPERVVSRCYQDLRSVRSSSCTKLFVRKLVTTTECQSDLIACVGDI